MPRGPGRPRKEKICQECGKVFYGRPGKKYCYECGMKRLMNNIEGIRLRQGIWWQKYKKGMLRYLKKLRRM